MDIRYIATGTTLYLPCYIDGCGLGVGDFHYAQGDGEVAGTAIEMGGRMTVTARVADDGQISVRRNFPERTAASK